MHWKGHSEGYVWFKVANKNLEVELATLFAKGYHLVDLERGPANSYIYLANPIYHK